MTSPQKIGVLTFHRCINYGSYWQARCLVESLRAQGHDAEILDHFSRRVNFAEWRCAFRPNLPTPPLQSDYPLFRQKIRKFFGAFESLPLSPCFNLDDPAAMKNYDTIVVGSDEVWNLSHPWFGGCPLFYGAGVRAKRLISYAASFGNYDAWAGLDAHWTNQLRNFDAISVRDENSRTIIRQALGCEPELVLDPCLQFPPQIQPEGDWHGPDSPFVAVYGHNFSPWFSEKISDWAKRRGLRTVSIGYRNEWADEQWIDAGPHDFAQAMARATAVATNFFHGCVFALHNQKPFICETSSYRSLKVQGLMATVGAEEHLASPQTPASTYDARLSEPLAPAIFERINGRRRASQFYLDRALA